MSTRLVLLSLVSLIVLGNRLSGEERPAKGRIVSLGLFKNGLATVKHELQVDAPGTYRLDDAPEPIHGTYWVESEATVETLVKMREVDVPAGTTGNVNLQEELAGKTVTVQFREGKVPPVRGTVVELTRPKGESLSSAAGWSSRSRPWDEPPAPDQPARFLLLQTAKGRVYVDASQIAYVESEGTPEKIKRRKPVLLLTIDKIEKPATIRVTYLARGMTWAPSYRIDITDPKTLTLEQTAVVKNELTAVKDTDISLISGFPSVQFAHVTSPLSARTTWTMFFQELSQRASPMHDIAGNSIVAQQAAPVSASVGLDLSATPAGEGVDLHYQSIGKRTLGEGDALGLSVAKGKAAYERVVEWLVPDNRNEYGQHTGRDESGEQDGAWDALRFKNPLSFPMTTGPALVVSGGRFNGQRMTSWVNAGEETLLRVTKALSVRTRSTEFEEQSKNGVENRDIVYVGGRAFRKANVQGELAISNHRQETISLVIRRRFSGELLNADGAPKQALREEGVYSVNKRYELSWRFPLKPGEEKKLGYQYSVLVHN